MDDLVLEHPLRVDDEEAAQRETFGLQEDAVIAPSTSAFRSANSSMRSEIAVTSVGQTKVKSAG